MIGHRPTELEIHRDILRANLKFLKNKNRANFFCPMIKADAYGHGALEVAKIAIVEGCKFVGVALYEEGIALRKAGLVDVEILVFSPLTDSALQASLEWKLTPVISAQNDLAILQQRISKDHPMTIHMKINVGMNRLGFSLKDANGIVALLHRIPGLNLVGACCHLPCAEDIGSASGVTISQLKNFLEFTQENKFQYVHALNSEALLKLSAVGHSYLDSLGSRPGIALYGIGHPDLRPAMSVRSRVIQIQNLRAGESVSYGGRWTATRDSAIGVVPIGYADGVRRGLSHNLSVLVQGKVIQVVGTICMDYIMIDITDLDTTASQSGNLEVRVMDLSKSGLTVADWAQRMQTIPYEIMVGFGSRLRKVYR